MNPDYNILWQNIRNGDEYALEKVYKAAFMPLVYYAKVITRQTETAEEVVQDVFLKIWQNRSVLIIKGSFKAYLYQSVHNQALNVIRQQNTRKESVNLTGSDSTWKFITDTYDINDNLIERIFSEETEVIIDRIIGNLPEQSRKVFQMSRFQSLKNDEIAAQLGLSSHTVKTHIYRALRKITLALNREK
jgi:RNA polymerase sigma-70 factor, ECF subfamily